MSEDDGSPKIPEDLNTKPVPNNNNNNNNNNNTSATTTTTTIPSSDTTSELTSFLRSAMDSIFSTFLPEVKNHLDEIKAEEEKNIRKSKTNDGDIEIKKSTDSEFGLIVEEESKTSTISKTETNSRPQHHANITVVDDSFDEFLTNEEKGKDSHAVSLDSEDLVILDK